MIYVAVEMKLHNPITLHDCVVVYSYSTVLLVLSTVLMLQPKWGFV